MTKKYKIIFYTNKKELIGIIDENKIFFRKDFFVSLLLYDIAYPLKVKQTIILFRNDCTCFLLYTPDIADYILHKVLRVVVFRCVSGCQY